MKKTKIGVPSDHVLEGCVQEYLFELGIVIDQNMPRFFEPPSSDKDPVRRCGFLEKGASHLYNFLAFTPPNSLESNLFRGGSIHDAALLSPRSTSFAKSRTYVLKSTWIVWRFAA